MYLQEGWPTAVQPSRASQRPARDRARARGERTARVGQLGATAGLRELAAAFDQMAAPLDGQEQLRHDLIADVAHELRTPVATGSRRSGGGMELGAGISMPS